MLCVISVVLVSATVEWDLTFLCSDSGTSQRFVLSERILHGKDAERNANEACASFHLHADLLLDGGSQHELLCISRFHRMHAHGTFVDSSVSLSLHLRLPSYLIVSFASTSYIARQSVLAGESIGLLVGTTIYDMEKALTVMTVFSLFLMLLGGFFVQNIPTFIAWAKYLSPFKYAFDASLQIVFNSDVQCDSSGALEELCGGSSTGSVPPEDVLDFFGVQGSVGFNVGILCVLIFIPRFVAYRALRAKRGGERS